MNTSCMKAMFFKDDIRENLPEMADLVWRPYKSLSDKQLDQFLEQMINERSFSIDQAIGLLTFFNYDVDKTIVASNRYKPIQDEWTKEEKIMFEHAFWFHNKNFNKIKLLVSSQVYVSQQQQQHKK